MNPRDPKDPYLLGLQVESLRDRFQQMSLKRSAPDLGPAAKVARSDAASDVTHPDPWEALESKEDSSFVSANHPSGRYSSRGHWHKLYAENFAKGFYGHGRFNEYDFYKEKAQRNPVEQEAFDAELQVEMLRKRLQHWFLRPNVAAEVKGAMPPEIEAEIEKHLQTYRKQDAYEKLRANWEAARQRDHFYQSFAAVYPPPVPPSQQPASLLPSIGFDNPPDYDWPMYGPRWPPADEDLAQSNLFRDAFGVLRWTDSGKRLYPPWSY